MLRVITKHSLMPRSSREKQNQPWPGKNIMFNAKVYALKENPALGNCLFHALIDTQKFPSGLDHLSLRESLFKNVSTEFEIFKRHAFNLYGNGVTSFENHLASTRLQYTWCGNVEVISIYSVTVVDANIFFSCYLFIINIVLILSVFQMLQTVVCMIAIIL